MLYTARKTGIGKLRAYERELAARYGELLLRKRFDEAKALFEQRRRLRRAVLQAEEWQVDGADDIVVPLPRQVQLEEEIARAA
ncbi:MAG: hypothetical protein HY332_13520 [Chloroflexi bacterium]|nr:hypothetical protein [Chloroflexota bacterium]